MLVTVPMVASLSQVTIIMQNLIIANLRLMFQEPWQKRNGILLGAGGGGDVDEESKIINRSYIFFLWSNFAPSGL